MSLRAIAARRKPWSKCELWPTNTARLQPCSFTSRRMVWNMLVKASISNSASRSGSNGSIPVKSSASFCRLAPSKGWMLALMLSCGCSRPCSSIRRVTMAISSSASVSALKPPVSTSTTTGKKPRKRRAMGVFSAALLFCVTDIRSVLQFPAQGFTRAQRYDYILAEGHLSLHLPVLFNQGDFIAVAWQAVKVRAMEAGKAFQFVQGAQVFKNFGVQFNGAVSGVAACTATGVFFGALGVRGTVSAEEEFWIAAGDHILQRLLVDI